MQGRLEVRVGRGVQVVHVPRVALGVEQLIEGRCREVNADEVALVIPTLILRPLLVLGVQCAVGQYCAVCRCAVGHAS